MLPSHIFALTLGTVLALMSLASESFASENQLADTGVDSGGITQYFNSTSGHYRLRYRSEIVPIVINQIHTWVIYLETADGQAIHGADITIEGGMPEHDHGLPTSPQISARDNNEYLVEGIRFHMRGYWELEIKISTGTDVDTVLIPLDL